MRRIFYDVSRNYKYDEVEYIAGTKWESIKCSHNDGHQRNGKRIGNLKVKITGKKNGNFLWTFIDWIIVDRVVNILENNNVIGYDLKPVDIDDREFQNKLSEFIVTGKGGEAHKDSGIYLKEKCDYCGLKIYSAYENGIIVDENKWDGSDIFTVVGYLGHILVTERVKELIEKHKLTGVILTPSHELKWPKGVIKP